MEKIKDAAYSVMMNKELRYEFLKVYDEFPSLYDGYQKKIKNEYPKRLYTTNNEDFYKIAGVFCEAEKNKELMRRLGEIFETHLRMKLLNKQVSLTKEPYTLNPIESGKIWDELVALLDMDCYYEYHYLYIYFQERSDLFNDLKEYDPIKVVIKNINPRSFKQISNDFNKNIKINASKMKFENRWKEIFEAAKFIFSDPHSHAFVWSSFIREMKDFEWMENIYVYEMSKPNNEIPVNLMSDLKPIKPVSFTASYAEKHLSQKRGFSIELAFTYELILVMSSYIKEGIDAPMILFRNPLKDKEIRDIVYMAKHGRKIRGMEEPETNSDWLSCVHEVCILCMEKVITKNFISAIAATCKEKNTNNVTEDGAQKKSLEKTLLSLKNKNERLNKILEEKEKKYEQIIREQKNNIKELNSRVYELNKELECFNDTEEKNESEDADTNIIVEEENIKNEKAKEYGEKEFIEFIKNHKILIWGVREKTERKYAELYPELSFANSDRDLTFRQVSSYDAVIVNTSYTSHSKYFRARDTIKSAKVPFAVLDNSANNQSQLWKAGEELEEKLQKN